ncbi:MAG: UPF0182 family protein [Longimicrobiales bacterium]
MAEPMTRRGRIVLTVAIVAGLTFILGGSVARLYTDALWFNAAGLAPVFKTRLFTTVVVRIIAGLAAGAFVFANLWLVTRRLGPVRVRRRYGNIEIAEQVPRTFVTSACVVIALLAGWWLATMQFGGSVPLALAAWLKHTSWGIADPLFHRDLSFYVFTLPVALLALDFVLVTFFWSLLLVAMGYSFVGGVRVQEQTIEIDPSARQHFATLAAAVLVALAFRFVVSRYALAVGGTGVQGAVGYTDIHARLLGHWVLAALAVVAAGSILYASSRHRIAPALAGIGAFVIGGIVFAFAYPATIQALTVRPNQLEREQKYIGWNLEFTRRAFGLTDVERVHVGYETATQQTWNSAGRTLQQLALWDVDQLQDAFNQVQSFQGYYTFTDVDFDRYAIAGSTHEVGVGVREFKQDGLPAASRNWFNLHLNPEFTRGVGVVVAETNTAIAGAPEYLVGELTPIRTASRAADLMTLKDPSIYYGEQANDYIVLDGAGGGGVSLGSFLRKIAFAMRFRDQNLLFAGKLNSSSHLLFMRNVRERMEHIAPFIDWDPDALSVIVDGHVKWILDGYTTSHSFPMSTHRDVLSLQLRSINYIHGSVKATVDAVTGKVELYATDAGDPILHSYAAIFPGLIRPATQMPAWVREHLRYPATLLTLQADIMQLYHVQQPNEFFAGQNAWEVPAQGAARGTPRPNEPLYLLLPLPGDTAPEFVSLLPFTARARQNLTAMLIARNDPASYGHLSLLDLAGDVQIKGPAQIQSLIEQDPEISQQLSLWRQLGTAVELGQLRIIPTGNSILYVEPLFLAAEEKAIPQLHRVLVSDGAGVAMAETLESAISDLYAGKGSPGRDQKAPVAGAPVPALPPADRAGWPAEALRLYDQAERQLRAGDFAAFGVSWQKLRTVLQNAAQER